MENNNPADLGGWRFLLEEDADGVNRALDTILIVLHSLIMVRETLTGPILSAEGIRHIYNVILIIRCLLTFLTRRLDIDPNYQLVFSWIAAMLGCVECALLICALHCDWPEPIMIAWDLTLVLLLWFIVN